jgi:hypothetical protein
VVGLVVGCGFLGSGILMPPILICADAPTANIVEMKHNTMILSIADRR